MNQTFAEEYAELITFVYYCSNISLTAVVFLFGTCFLWYRDRKYQKRKDDEEGRNHQRREWRKFAERMNDDYRNLRSNQTLEKILKVKKTFEDLKVHSKVTGLDVLRYWLADDRHRNVWSESPQLRALREDLHTIFLQLNFCSSLIHLGEVPKNITEELRYVVEELGNVAKPFLTGDKLKVASTCLKHFGRPVKKQEEDEGGGGGGGEEEGGGEGGGGEEEGGGEGGGGGRLVQGGGGGRRRRRRRRRGGGEEERGGRGGGEEERGGRGGGGDIPGAETKREELDQSVEEIVPYVNSLKFDDGRRPPTNDGSPLDYSQLIKFSFNVSMPNNHYVFLEGLHCILEKEENKTSLARNIRDQLAELPLNLIDPFSDEDSNEDVLVKVLHEARYYIHYLQNNQPLPEIDGINAVGNMERLRQLLEELRASPVKIVTQMFLRRCIDELKPFADNPGKHLCNTEFFNDFGKFWYHQVISKLRVPFQQNQNDTENNEVSSDNSPHSSLVPDGENNEDHSVNPDGETDV